MKEYSQDVIDQFRSLWMGRDDRYGHYDPISKKSWTEGKRGPNGEMLKDKEGATLPPPPLTDQLIVDHLQGRLGLGLVPIKLDGNLRYAALDIDNDDIDHVMLAKRVQENGLPMYVFKSKSGAAHVYIFFTGDGKPADVVMKRLELYATTLGCGRDLIKAEIFPKQSDISAGRVGNWLNLPFFDDANGTARTYVAPDGTEMGLTEFLGVVEPFDSAFSLPIPVRSETFNQGPPCLEKLQEVGVQPGHMHNALYNAGVYYRLAFPLEWESYLHTFNKKFLKPPVESRYVATVIKGLKKKDYKYKCSQDPIVSYCEKELCKTRTFGIMSPEERTKAAAAKINLPITALKKYNCSPGRWGLMFDEDEVIVDSKDIMNYNVVRIHLLDKMNIIPPVMKNTLWEAKLTDLMQNNCTLVEVSGDSSEHKLAAELLENYVNQGRPSEGALDFGDAYQVHSEAQGGCDVYVTTRNIRQWLTTADLRFKVHEVTVLLRQLGWESKTKYLDKMNRRVWHKFHAGLEPGQRDQEAAVREALKRQVDECHSGAVT